VSPDEDDDELELDELELDELELDEPLRSCSPSSSVGCEGSELEHAQTSAADVIVRAVSRAAFFMGLSISTMRAVTAPRQRAHGAYNQAAIRPKNPERTLMCTHFPLGSEVSRTLAPPEPYEPQQLDGEAKKRGKSAAEARTATRGP
jgi:hypothetical protein